jgi:hypothetical protein
MGAAKDYSKYTDYLRSANEKIGEAGQEQINALEVDFDEAVREYRDEHPPFAFKFNGKTYMVQSELTADVEFFLTSVGREMNTENAKRLIRMIIGDEFMDECIAQRVPSALLEKKVIVPIFDKWGLTGAKYVPDSKNVKTPSS